MECYQSGQPLTDITLGDPDIAQRWPQFIPVARQSGFVSTNAIPLRLRGRVIGALGLFQTNDDALSDADTATATTVAAKAALRAMPRATGGCSEGGRAGPGLRAGAVDAVRTRSPPRRRAARVRHRR